MKAINNIPGTNGCISEKMLLDYTRGKLHSKEQHIVEKHLLDCELCNDALEGLNLLNKHDNVIEMVTSLKHEINQKLLHNKRKQPIIFQWWQMAAILVIVLISAGSYIIINNVSRQPTNSMAQNEQSEKQKPQTEPISNSSQPEKSKASSQSQVIKEKSKIENNINSDRVKEELQSATTVTGDNADTKESTFDMKGVTDESSIQTSTVHKKENEMPPVREESVKQTDAAIDIQKVGVSTVINEVRRGNSFSQDHAANQNAAFDRNYNEGLRFYNEKNYARALHYFRKAAPDIKIDFYTGVCHYNLKNYIKCVTSMDKATINPQTDFYAEALWYKARALVELKSNEDAKRVLYQIILLDSPFKAEAQKLLNNL